MPNHTADQGQHPFPAVVIAPLLLVFCVFPAQGLLTRLLPNLSGHATVDPSLIILDMPVRLPFPIDLILVPGLFLLLYMIAILIHTTRHRLPFWPVLAKRFTAMLSGAFFIFFCTAIGCLLSYLIRDHLPDRITKFIGSFGIGAALHLPHAGYPVNPLFGNAIVLFGTLTGLVIAIVKISTDPQTRRSTPLTREQRKTPYQRMLEERRQQQPPSSYRPCSNEPLLTLLPEAVNYRPLG